MTRRLTALPIALAVAASLVACSAQQAMERAVPEGHDRFARAYIASLRSGDFERGMAAIVPMATQPPGVRDSLIAAAQRLPEGGSDSLRLIGVNWIRTKDSRGTRITRSRLVYEYQAAAGWGLITVRVIDELGVKFIEAFAAQRVDQSQYAINAFHFSDKPALSYFVLILAVASAVWSLSVAVRAARTPMPRRWLWTVVALLAGSGVVLNWTTGEIQFQLISVVLLGAKVVRSGAGPWLIGAAVPVGAMLTYRHIKKWRAQQPAIPAPAS